MSQTRQLIRSLIGKLPIPLRRDLVLAGIAAGKSLADHVEYPSVAATLKYLKRKGFDPRFAIDVGAFMGEWTCEVKGIFPEARVLMVEPQAGKQPLLKSIAQRYGDTVRLSESLLGAVQDAEVQFHEMEQGSSVFKEQSYVQGAVKTRRLTTLDELLRRLSETSKIDLLKLDAQGYELEILKGAAEAIQRTEFVLMEASLIPINEGCPLILETMNFMAARGFHLFDTCGQWRRPDCYLWQMDLLFMHESSPLRPAPTLEGPSFSG